MAFDAAQMRRWICHLLIAIAFATGCGRIISVQRVYEPAFYKDASKWPKSKPDSNAMFGSNDRARWATIRSLVHDGTYVIGKRDETLAWVALVMADDPVQAVVLVQAGSDFRTDVSNPLSHRGIIFRDKEKEHGFATIDRVMNPATREFYSSKPPLLATLLAGVYWILYHLFGLSLIDHPVIVVRIMLILVNALPFAGYLWLLMQTAERWGRSDWGKLFVATAGAFATMVNPFLITLQNHTIGTFAVMLAWWSILRVWDRIAQTVPPSPEIERKPAPWYYFVSAGFFASFATTMEMPALSFLAAALVLLAWWRPRETMLYFVPAAAGPIIAFLATNYIAVGQLNPVQSEFESPWYRYEGSHWNPPLPGFTKTGIDWARRGGGPNAEQWPHYALHVLVGHHGWFSLTPIWLLALAAMLAGCWRWGDLLRQALLRETDDFPWFVQPLGLALTLVVVGFYLIKSDNYGGFTNGLRWLMWLTPIWLTCLLPMADRLAALKAGRWLSGTLLAISIFSMSYQLWSPWRHPWIFDLMIELGWPGY